MVSTSVSYVQALNAILNQWTVYATCITQLSLDIVGARFFCMQRCIIIKAWKCNYAANGLEGDIARASADFLFGGNFKMFCTWAALLTYPKEAYGTGLQNETCDQIPYSFTIQFHLYHYTQRLNYFFHSHIIQLNRQILLETPEISQHIQLPLVEIPYILPFDIRNLHWSILWRIIHPMQKSGQIQIVKVNVFHKLVTVGKINGIPYFVGVYKRWRKGDAIVEGKGRKTRRRDESGGWKMIWIGQQRLTDNIQVIQEKRKSKMNAANHNTYVVTKKQLLYHWNQKENTPKIGDSTERRKNAIKCKSIVDI